MKLLSFSYFSCSCSQRLQWPSCSPVCSLPPCPGVVNKFTLFLPARIMRSKIARARIRMWCGCWCLCLCCVLCVCDWFPRARGWWTSSLYFCRHALCDQRSRARIRARKCMCLAVIWYLVFIVWKSIIPKECAAAHPLAAIKAHMGMCLPLISVWAHGSQVHKVMT